jgi:hypothetical protein
MPRAIASKHLRILLVDEMVLSVSFDAADIVVIPWISLPPTKPWPAPAAAVIRAYQYSCI